MTAADSYTFTVSPGLITVNSVLLITDAHGHLHLMVLNVILSKGNKPDRGIRELYDHQMQKLCESTGFRSGNTKTGM